MTPQLPNDGHPEAVHSGAAQVPGKGSLGTELGGSAVSAFSSPILMSHDEDVTRLLLSEPIPCGSCGVMHTFFINRGGKTRCFCCDQPIPRAREEFREFVSNAEKSL